VEQRNKRISKHLKAVGRKHDEVGKFTMKYEMKIVDARENVIQLNSKKLHVKIVIQVEQEVNENSNS